MANNVEVLAHLTEEQRRVNSSINLVVEVQRNGTKYQSGELTNILREVGTLNPGCAVCAAWDGQN